MLTVNILTVNTTAMLERDDIAVIMTGIIRESSTSAPNALETLSHSIGASESGKRPVKVRKFTMNEEKGEFIEEETQYELSLEEFFDYMLCHIKYHDKKEDGAVSSKYTFPQRKVNLDQGKSPGLPPNKPAAAKLGGGELKEDSRKLQHVDVSKEILVSLVCGTLLLFLTQVLISYILWKQLPSYSQYMTDVPVDELCADFKILENSMLNELKGLLPGGEYCLTQKVSLVTFV
jgi:hypothetical protein